MGDYEIEIGWVNEPPVAGQLNGIEISVSNTSTGEAQPVEDVSSLTVTISYGGQSKELTLEPLGEDTPGQFEAPILPTVPGQYTIAFGGQLGDTAVDAKWNLRKWRRPIRFSSPVPSLHSKAPTLG